MSQDKNKTTQVYTRLYYTRLEECQSYFAHWAANRDFYQKAGCLNS